MELKLGESAAVGPTNDPVEYQDARDHLRLTSDDDQAYVQSLIQTCAGLAETITGRALITQTWKGYLDSFPAGDAPIMLPKPPVQSITEIKYYDENNVLQTLGSSVYELDDKAAPATLTRQNNQTWPSTYDKKNAVEITFVCGYGATKASVPREIRQAILMLIAHYYFNRKEAVVVEGTVANAVEVPLGADMLLRSKTPGGYLIA